MEKYRYGPLIYNCYGEDDESGNFFWTGLPVVGYDADGIPVDRDGNQCLPDECILHPWCHPQEWEWCEYLQTDLPSRTWVRAWFEENFLEIDDYTVCKYIFKWYVHPTRFYGDKTKPFETLTSVEESIKTLWPDVQR